MLIEGYVCLQFSLQLRIQIMAFCVMCLIMGMYEPNDVSILSYCVFS
jgi:hypothetical protein